MPFVACGGRPCCGCCRGEVSRCSRRDFIAGCCAPNPACASPATARISARVDDVPSMWACLRCTSGVLPAARPSICLAPATNKPCPLAMAKASVSPCPASASVGLSRLRGRQLATRSLRASNSPPYTQARTPDEVRTPGTHAGSLSPVKCVSVQVRGARWR
eukprot:TRINITY_DN61029_c0_g1_i1.p3 TRINITY_DN61029_c0_g1~~TRINITY_DN61029_c0_g1_i1.p3  ORF type:complete len:161 (+),score=13.19 TRINITY_DN61029_c0_g1_i1:545-1027(+)